MAAEKSSHPLSSTSPFRHLNRFIPTALNPLFDQSRYLSDEWIQTQPARDRVLDQNASSIDWSFEVSKERLRIQALAELPGIRGMLARVWDGTIPWLVIIVVGLLSGCAASLITSLSAWLGDSRVGICRDMWWMSKASCCSGLDAGELCNAWRPWADVAGKNLFLRVLVSYSVYIVLAVAFASTGACLVKVYAPFAFHTGIIELKCILGGYKIDGFLSGWTLLIKFITLPLAVGSGLSLGSEGPLVHLSCCLAEFAMQPFAVLRGNQARQREILSAASAAGIASAFGAPLGGVLFSLEEVSTFFPKNTLWQAFVCSIIAATALQYIDPFGTRVLFEVKAAQIWRGFELIPWLGLGVLGGLWGVMFMKLNSGWERFRRSAELGPVAEVAGIALGTAVLSYLVVLMKIPTAELVTSLFQDCDVDTHGLCDASKPLTIVFLLLVTAFSKTFLTAITFGSAIPAGVFLPSLAIGSCVGRALGILMDALHKAYPQAFPSCPADGNCISPQIYAVIGAASFLAGVTKMTLSLVVIMFELTGAVDVVIQTMIAVMVSKFVGDFYSRSGIYETWIGIRNYPFLSNKVHYEKDLLASEVMTKEEDLLVLVDEGWPLSRLEAFLEKEEYRGYPVVRPDRLVLGYLSKLELGAALDKIRLAPRVSSSTPCFFSPSTSRGPEIGPLPHEEYITSPANAGDNSPSQSTTPAWVSLQYWMDETPMTLHASTPMPIVFSYFQRLGLRVVLFTNQGALAGLMTKMDLFTQLQPIPGLVKRRIQPSSVGHEGLTRRNTRREERGAGWRQDEPLELSEDARQRERDRDEGWK